MLTNKIYKLLIIEPWDAYGKYIIELSKRSNNQFLFKLNSDLNFKGNQIAFLVGILRDNKLDEFLESKEGMYTFNLFHNEKLNELSFQDIDSLRFRQGFFTGEIRL
jgi:hypothetical protein